MDCCDLNCATRNAYRTDDFVESMNETAVILVLSLLPAHGCLSIKRAFSKERLKHRPVVHPLLKRLLLIW
jgi:hypothetical protein